LASKTGVGPNQPVVCNSFERFLGAKKALRFNFLALQMDSKQLTGIDGNIPFLRMISDQSKVILFSGSTRNSLHGLWNAGAGAEGALAAAMCDMAK